MSSLLIMDAAHDMLPRSDSMPTNAFPRTTSESNDTVWLYDLLSNDWQVAWNHPPICSVSWLIQNLAFQRWINGASVSNVIHQSGSYSVVHSGTNLRYDLSVATIREISD